jgi:hypothetical protein
MGDVNIRYNPAYSVTGEYEVVEQPDDLVEVQQAAAQAAAARRRVRNNNNTNNNNAEETADIGIMNVPLDAIVGLTDIERWRELNDVEQHNRLVSAIMDLKE